MWPLKIQKILNSKTGKQKYKSSWQCVWHGHSLPIPPQEKEN